jgi:molybdopterin molybdotransferase
METFNDGTHIVCLWYGINAVGTLASGVYFDSNFASFNASNYPASAYIAFIEFIPPLVDFLLGTKHMPKPTIKAKLSRRIPGVLGSRTYIRVQVTERQGTVYVEPVSVSGAGIISSLVRANGFVIVPEKVEGYEEGEVVDVELFRPVVNEKVNK